MNPSPFKTTALILKHNHQEASTLALEIGQFLLERGGSLLFATESRATATKLSSKKFVPKSKIRVIAKEKIPTQADWAIVLGGDGTFLSIARLMKERSIPILGVNLGQLGFLTEVKKSEIRETLEAILSQGHAPLLSERALLEVTLRRKRKVIFQGPVVNDAVISKGAIARIINLEVSVDQNWVHDVRADGLIISTPTGSTAYSLAAGGPILEPSLDACVLTPICPHALTQRPLVIPDRCHLQIRLKNRPGHVLLTLDGQEVVDLQENDLVSIRRFKKHRLKIIRAGSRDYFTLLREKLKFGMRE